MKQLLIDTRIGSGLEINDSIGRGCVINFHKSHAVRACFDRQRGRRISFSGSTLLAQKRILHRLPMKQNFCPAGLNARQPASFTPRENCPATHRDFFLKFGDGQEWPFVLRRECREFFGWKIRRAGRGVGSRQLCVFRDGLGRCGA